MDASAEKCFQRLIDEQNIFISRNKLFIYVVHNVINQLQSIIYSAYFSFNHKVLSAFFCMLICIFVTLINDFNCKTASNPNHLKSIETLKNYFNKQAWKWCVQQK